MSVEIEGVKLYTINEVAKMLHIHERTVRNKVRSGELDGKRIGRPILISESSVKRFLAPIK